MDSGQVCKKTDMLAANNPAVFPHLQLPWPLYPLSFSSLLYYDRAFNYIILIGSGRKAETL